MYSQNGITPCMVGVLDNSLEMVKLLCEHGAQVNTQNKVSIDNIQYICIKLQPYDVVNSTNDVA